MKYIVHVSSNGYDFYLRSTTWAYSADRVDRFPTIDAAKAALQKARKFTKPSIFKVARVVEDSTP